MDAVVHMFVIVRIVSENNRKEQGQYVVAEEPWNRQLMKAQIPLT